MGNLVLLTALLPVLRARFPGARIDVLAGDAMTSVLAGLDLGTVQPLPRRMLRAPWQVLSLLGRLRRERYDLAVDGGLGSFSGGFYAWLVGAPHRLGQAGPNDRWLTARIPIPAVSSVYAIPRCVAENLQVDPALAWPRLRVRSDEQERASADIVTEFGAPVPDPLVGVFVGGHGGKRWPAEFWIGLISQLAEKSLAALVFVGPEEAAMVDTLSPYGNRRIRILPPGPLRAFFARIQRTSILITPDSGPMHVAAALGRPVIALLQSEHSRFYVPDDPRSLALVRPTVADVVTALRGHVVTRADDRPALMR